MMARYETCADPERRHDYLLLFDVTDGNPNGDPDAGNMPRVDPETMQGLVTDVCLKRKVRDYVSLTRRGETPNRIYVQNQGIALNDLHQQGYAANGLRSQGKSQPRPDVDRVRSWMCSQFYDIRMFGAVMSTGVNAGQVRGPMQLTFARSIDPIAPLDVTITRIAVTRAEDVKVVVAEEGREGTGGKITEMGRKALLPYGLYLARGFFSPSFARQTNVRREDLELFWDALRNMWDHDHSAGRGMMSCRGLYIFSHDNALGSAPSHTLFDTVKVAAKSNTAPPRHFSDYTVTIDRNWPAGITFTSLADS